MQRVQNLLILMALLMTAGGFSSVRADVLGWRQNTDLLPSYCAYRVSPGGKENRANRYPLLRSIWIHIHHYCGGIYAEVKAKTTADPKEKAVRLNQVITQMAYVGGSCKPNNCVLYPELHTRWGWALKEQGKLVEAVKHFEMAIKAKPDYVKAYTQLADLYADNHRPDEARQVLKKGLEHKPNSRALRRRLKRLETGGAS